MQGENIHLDEPTPTVEEGRAPSRGRRITFGIVRLGIGVALLVVLGTTGILDWGALRGLLDRWQFTALAVVAIATAISATAWRLCILLSPRKFGLGLGASLRLTFIGTFFNIAMPGSSGGDLIRIYYAAKGNDGRKAEIATILLLDRFIGLIALVLYPVILAPLYLSLLLDNAALRTVVFSAAGIVAVIGFCAWLFLRGAAGAERWIRLLDRVPGGEVIRRAAGTLRSYGSDRRPLWKALSVSLGAHALGMLGFVLLARAVFTPGFEWVLFVIVPIGMVVNTIPLTPGGLGVGEAAFAVLFGMAGLSGGPEVLISWRLVSVLVGLPGLLFYLQGRTQFVSALASGADRDVSAPPSSGPQRGDSASSVARTTSLTGA